MSRSVPIARRNILADRRRLTISTVGVGLAVALIFLLEGLWAGLLDQISAYPDHLDATYVARAASARSLVEGSVPPTAPDAIRSIPGVTRADPVIAHYVILDLHGSKKPAVVIGYDPGGAGGPWSIAEGQPVSSGSRGIVMDETLAHDHGIDVGGSLEMQGRPFAVTGLSAGTQSFMGVAYVFTSLETARAIFGQEGTATFVLVDAEVAGRVGDEIARATGLAVETPDQVARDERELYATILGKPIVLMVVVAFVAGTLIVALTVYSAIVDRIREYGIAKAIGARWTRLLRIVAGQTLVLAALGLISGAVFYEGGSRLIVALRPQFESVLTPRIVGEVVVAAIVMGLLAAIVPTRRVTRLDPADVYKG